MGGLGIGLALSVVKMVGGSILTGLTGGGLNGFVNSVIEGWAKIRNVDLQKFRTAATTTGELGAHIVEANTKFAQMDFAYKGFLLGFWYFRLAFGLLFWVVVLRWVLVFTDATLPFVFGYEPWSIEALKGAGADYERQILLFFIVAKPVDSAITGATRILMKVIERRG